MRSTRRVVLVTPRAVVVAPVQRKRTPVAITPQLHAHPRRRSAMPARGHVLAPALALIGLLIVWFAASLIVPSLLLPSPLDVGTRLVSQTELGITGRYLWPTVVPALGGLLVAVVTALALAIAVTRSRWVAAVVEPWVALSQTVPLVAIAPILVLWLGYGQLPIAVLCAIIAFFPMVTTMTVGLRSLDRTVIEHAQLDGTTGWQRLGYVELPMAMPAILAGVRAGAVLSMTGAVVGELVMGGKGLGTLLTLSRQASDTVGVFTVIVWISAAALVLYAALSLAIARAARTLGEDER